MKRGEAGALKALGYGSARALSIRAPSIAPATVREGESVTVAFDVVNKGRRKASAVVDFRIHFVKAGGRTAPKVFKLKAVELAPGASTRLAKKVSLAALTTRKHYPGIHAVDALVNAVPAPIGRFRFR